MGKKKSRTRKVKEGENKENRRRRDSRRIIRSKDKQVKKNREKCR